MNELYLSESMIARSFWNELRSSTRSEEAVSETSRVFEHAEEISKLFETQTGSISRTSALLIWLLARYFQPKTIAEVGTYIGRSTLSLRGGAASTLEFLATCDGSYDCWMPPVNDANMPIRYFGKTTSTVMFQQLVTEEKKIDLFLLDGRISKEDIDLIQKLRTANSVFIVDDFEGVEKGVVNVLMLRERFNDLLLLAPEYDLSDGWNDSHSLAVLVPSSNLRLTRQQRLPLELM
jgi:hypothetical protein